MTALLVDLDGALGDTRPLWQEWLAESARVLGVDVATLPSDRADAADALDAAGAGNWRVLLDRFAEERAPVYLRPAADASAALRRVAASGTAVGVFTDAPLVLARIALDQLGASRRVAALETGRDALALLRSRFGSDSPVARTREELIRAAP